jgi:hypothetical protein
MVICRRKPSIRDRVQKSSARAGRYRRGAFDFVLVVALLQLRTGFNGVFVRFKEKKVLDPHQRFQCELQRTLPIRLRQIPTTFSEAVLSV